MKVLVCGSRHFNDYEHTSRVLSTIDITELIHGGARGADTCGAMYAEANSIPVRRFPALWDLHGKRAGPIRNSQMLREGAPDLCVAFLAKDSRGTKNMIDIAQKAGVKTLVINI